MNYKYVDIYLYDPVTKEFMAKGKSDKNPLDPETPIIPACATTIEPSDKKDGFATVWVGNKWEYKEDHRGEIWYNAVTKTMVEIKEIGPIPENYYTPDSPIANPPDGNYWVFNKQKNEWEPVVPLYKQEVMNSFSVYWEIKNTTPYTYDGHRYITSWRDLYNSIYSTMKEGIKTEYRLQDYDGNLFYVDLKYMKDIYTKMANIIDEMYIDKQNLQLFFAECNDYKKLDKKLQEYLNKVYE